MTSKVFLYILSFILSFEGGYVKTANDPGGATNKGITQATYNRYRIEHSLQKQTVKKISDYETKYIYYNDYFLRSHSNDMGISLSIVHFDASVNFGINKARTLLNRTIGFKDDTPVTTQTISFIKAHNQDSLANIYVNERIKERYSIVKRKPKSKKFLKGWLKRDYKLYEIIKSTQ